MTLTRTPARAVWALGATQIIGYGTLYYSFSLLAPQMARDFGLPETFVFGALSVSLFLGSLWAPYAGRLADRHGAGRLMSYGSVLAAAALAACALAPERITFLGALVAMEVAGCFVLYGTAFVAIVQTGGSGGRRGITHLTLIAGFASTLFWPLTAMLDAHLDWRTIYLIFAALNLVVCLPLHVWIARLPVDPGRAGPVSDFPSAPVPDDAGRRVLAARLFPLMLAGFALQGFVLSALSFHMVPLVTALGSGAAGVYVAMVFGPAQVLSRLANMVAGSALSQTWLAVIAGGMLPFALAVLLVASPWLPAVLVFVALAGLGSGLISIVLGTLPLELFGRQGYGARLGVVGAVRQVASALAPVALSLSLAFIGVMPAVWLLFVLGLVACLAFGTIAVLWTRMPDHRLP